MYIGIDLGGTNIAIGLVDKDAKIVKSGSRPTLSGRPYTEIVRDMAELTEELLASADLDKSAIESIGIGSPGSIDLENGVITFANNLGWNNVPLADELGKYFNVPISVINDANAAAYGEFCAGNQTEKSFVAITLGTGVGGGIIIDKKIYTGFNGRGGELGHITIAYDGLECNCGNIGCWEKYASVTALINQTAEAIEKNPDSLMVEYAKEKGKVSGRTAFDAAKAGDKAAQEVVDKYIYYVACGITSIINIFQPEVLVIGGGISAEGDYLLNPIKKFVIENSYGEDGNDTEIKIATLKNDAGIIGAAFASRI